MGFSFDAFMAGTRPNTTPMTMEKATAMMHAGTLMATGVPMMWDIISARPMPVATPSMPPMLVSTAASVRNCQRMRLCCAPMAI